MKKILPIILAIFLLSSCLQDDLETITKKPFVVANEEEEDDLTSVDFIKGSEDIPLLSRLEQIDGDNVDFDSESGSVSSVSYKSSIDLEVVQAFYLKTLPQMGWKIGKNNQNHTRFIREGEKLDIDFIESDSEDGIDEVRFSLSSAAIKK